MKRILRTLATLGALAALAAPSWAQRSSGEYVPGQLIIKFRPGVRGIQVASAVARTQEGARAQRVVAGFDGPVALASIPSGTTIEQAIATFEANPDVLYAEANAIVKEPQDPVATRSTAVHPSGIVRLLDSYDDTNGGRPVFREKTFTPGYSPSSNYPNEEPNLNQWGWFYVGGNIVWTRNYGTPVAIVDTGADARHPDLLRHVYLYKDVVENDGRPLDDNGHGTMLAGIVGAATNNRQGISGMNGAKVVAIKAVNFAGYTNTFDLAQGIRLGANYKVILVGVAIPDDSQTLRDAVYYATYLKGRLLVAPAGDAPEGQPGDMTPMYPAAYAAGNHDVYVGGVLTPVDFVDRVLSVGAQGTWVDSTSDPDSDPDTFVEYCKAPYSQYGDWVTMAAPGTDITTTTPFRKDYYNLRNGDTTEGYNSYSGTSLAAAFVAGAAARVFGQQPAFTNLQVARRLLGTYATTNHALNVYTGDVDVDGDGTPEIANCWDPDHAQSIDENINSNRTLHLVDTNVAMASQVSSIWWRVYDAFTGLPLSGARGLALNDSKLLRRTSYQTGTNGDPLDGEIDLVNVQWYSENYKCRVQRNWYTNGPWDVFPMWSNFRHLYLQGPDIAIPPPGGNDSLVLTWGTYADTPFNLDLHVLFPTGTDSQCEVGPPDAPLVPTAYCGVGSTARAPYTRLMYDSSQGQARQMDTIAIRRPYYATDRLLYSVFVTDSTGGADITGHPSPYVYLAEGHDHGWIGNPNFRVWRSGNVVRNMFFGLLTKWQGREGDGTDPPKCTVDPTTPPGTAICDRWQTVNFTQYVPYNTQTVDEFGDGVNSAILPFTGPGASSVWEDLPTTPAYPTQPAPFSDPASRVTNPAPSDRLGR